MKPPILFCFLSTVVIIYSGCSSKQEQHAVQTDTTIAVTGDYYTCPMHPFVRSDRPGVCPICGMVLVKKTGKESLTPNQLKLLIDVSLSPSQMVLANVDTATVHRGMLNREFSAAGVVAVAEPFLATIAARFSGRVGKLYADYTGVTVRKGEPLFDLYSPDLISATQDYILALGGFRSAHATSEIQNASAQERLVTASRARLKNHFGMTETQITQLEKTQQLPTSVRFDSPIRGTVLSKEVQEGQYVEEGTVLYKLADLSKVWIYLDVYEQNMRYLEVGQPVSLTTDAYPGQVFNGKVMFIDPTMSSDSRTIKVRAEFANPDLKLKPNMYVEARIHAPVEEALVVPISSIIQTGKRSVVWVEVRANTFAPRNVILGASTDDESEILEGLHEGDVVAVSGGFLIDSESQLNQPSGQDAAAQSTPQKQDFSTGSDVKAYPSKYLHALSLSEQAMNVNILVHGSYSPEVIHGIVGRKLRLHFYRDEDSDCTSVVVFKVLNIRQFLAPHDTTLVEITPTKVGTINFECGEGMVHGKIIVSK